MHIGLELVDFLDPTYRHNEQKHCLICRAAYKVGAGARSLKDPCARAGEAGFAEMWSGEGAAAAASQRCPIFPTSVC